MGFPPSRQALMPTTQSPFSQAIPAKGILRICSFLRPSPHVLSTRRTPGHQAGHMPSGTRALETGRRSSCPPLTKPLRGAFHQRLGMKSARGKTAAAALWASNHLPERTLEQSCGPARAPGLPELWARAQLPLGSHGVAYSLGKSLEEMKGWAGGWNLRMNRCHLHVPELQPEQKASKGQEPFQGG